MGFDFSIEPPEVVEEEQLIRPGDLDGALRKLALAKALSVSERRTAAIVLAGDTVVAIHGRILGKPRDRESARVMLLLLSGQRHEVHTGVALVCAEAEFVETRAVRTDVCFRDVPEQEIDDYLCAEEFLDKAGAYAIQGKALTFVDSINGCFYNVVGLPVRATIDLCDAYAQHRKGL